MYAASIWPKPDKSQSTMIISAPLPFAPKGSVGTIMRPGRDIQSCACGALRKCLVEFQIQGYETNCGTPGATKVTRWPMHDSTSSHLGMHDSSHLNLK